MSDADPYLEIRRALHAATQRAFSELHKQFPDEHFYVFALRSDGLGQSVTAMTNSLEALRERAEELQGSSYETAAEAEEYQRWHPGEWGFIPILDEAFQAVNAQVHAITKNFWPQTDQMDDLGEQHAKQLHEVCTEVLADLNREGFFGEGNARSKLTVLMIPDEIGSQWVVERAYRMNPKLVAARFETQVAPASEKEGTWERLGSKNVYTMYQLAFSADKTVLASIGYNLFACRRDEQNAWNELFLMRWEDPFGGVAISPDGKTLFVATKRDDETNEIRRFDLTAGKKKELKKWSAPARFRSLSFSRDGRWLAGEGASGQFFILDGQTGDIVARPVAAEKDRYLDVEFAPDGTMLATASYQATRLWRTSDWTEIRTIEMPCKRLAFSPDGRLLAMCAGKRGDVAGYEDESTLVIADVATGKTVQHIARDEQIDSVAFSPDERLIAVGGDILGKSASAQMKAMSEATTRVAKARATGESLENNPEHVAYLAAKKAYKPREATLTLYDVRSAQVQGRLICGISQYNDVAFLDNKHVLFAGMNDNDTPPIGVWTIS
jgi:hypothetical protein